MKKYVIMLLEREDWDSPQIKQVNAKNETEAYAKFAKKIGFTAEELEEGEEGGEISVHIHKVK